ncbi:MAG: hypothetical protein ACR2GH_23105 [Pseudonocardia sp.]
MAQNCSAPVKVWRHPETFCRSLIIADLALCGVVIERNTRIPGEAQVVVLTVEQAMGQGVVGAHQLRRRGR